MRAIWLSAVVCLVAMLPAQADTLPDPTRPVNFVPRAAGKGGAAVPEGPVLQSTIVSSQRRSAVISGQRVEIGDKYDGALIVDIKPYEVRMTRGGRETTLRMLPKLSKEKGRAE